VGSALSRAYGRWAKEFCSIAPKRLRIAYPLNLFDVETAVRDARWAVKEIDAVTLMVLSLPVAGRGHHHPDFDPVWAVAQELGVPIMAHSLSSLPDASGRGPLVDISPGVSLFGGNLFLHHMVAHRVQQHLTMASFLVGGVLERFPDLKVLFVEAGGSWVQAWLDAMDDRFGNPQTRRTVPWLRMAPSEYFQRQCLVSFGPGEHFVEGTIGRVLPATSVGWSSDYPHYDSLPSDAVARTALSHLDAGTAAGILGGNVRRLLGW
jgi:predicted TIM-barrel fold metal-dependent hydrolase